MSSPSREELAKQLSQWAQGNMCYDISPDSLAPLFNSSELSDVWIYIMNNMKCVTPLDTLLLKANEFTQPPSDVLRLHKTLSEEEKTLDFEIENIQKNLEMQSIVMKANDEKIRKLKSEVSTHGSKMEIMKAYGCLLGKQLQEVNEFLQAILPLLPHCGSNNGDISLFAKDIQGILSRICSYYQMAGNERSAELIHSIHNKIRQMIKLYRNDQLVEYFATQVDIYKMQHKEESDIPMIKKEMEKSISQLHAAHKVSFISLMKVQSDVQVLEAQRAELMSQLKHSAESASQLQELYNLKLKVIEQQELIKSLSEPMALSGMPSLCVTNLQQVQQQIKEEEEALMMIQTQIAKVRHYNRTTLDSIPTLTKNDFEEEFRTVADESDTLLASFQTDEIYKCLEQVEVLLPQLIPFQSEVHDLSVRPGYQVMSDEVKDKLLSSLDMPPYDAPEMLGIRLQEKMDELGATANITRVQKEALKTLDLLSSRSKFNEIGKVIRSCDIKARDLTEKTEKVVVYVDGLLNCKDCEEGLEDFKQQPAFDINVL